MQWIEPPLPFMTTNNSSNRIITQADTVQATPYNLDGAGVNVLVSWLKAPVTIRMAVIIAVLASDVTPRYIPRP